MLSNKQIINENVYPKNVSGLGPSDGVGSVSIDVDAGILTIGDLEITKDTVSSPSGTIQTYDLRNSLDDAIVTPLLYMDFLDTYGSYLQENSNSYPMTASNVTDGTNVATFNGSTSYIKYDETDFKTNTGTISALTISVRFKQASPVAGTKILCQVNSAAGRSSLRITNGELNIFHRDGASTLIDATTTIGGSAYSDNSFHYALFIMGSGGNSLYVDGTVVSSITYATGSGAVTSLTTDPDEVSIGADFRDGLLFGSVFTGDINRVYISSTALDVSQITAITNLSDPSLVTATHNTIVYGPDTNVEYSGRTFLDTVGGLQSITVSNTGTVTLCQFDNETVATNGNGFSFTNNRFTNTSGYTKTYFVNAQVFYDTMSVNSFVVLVLPPKNGTASSVSRGSVGRIDGFDQPRGANRIDTVAVRATIVLDDDDWFEIGVTPWSTPATSNSCGSADSGRYDLYSRLQVLEL